MFISPLQPKACLTFNFIYTWRALSNHKIPYQAFWGVTQSKKPVVELFFALLCESETQKSLILSKADAEKMLIVGLNVNMLRRWLHITHL